MRVIGGSARGRRLHAPRGMLVRPTADRVKEALFSIICSREGSLDGKRVLDLCAGCGGLGIEALSRGAFEAVFVDNDRQSATYISRNLAMTGFDGQGRVMIRDACAALKDLERCGEQFHLVFLDPPYRHGLAEKLLGALAGSRLLAEAALVVAEIARDETLSETFGALREVDRRAYGDTSIAFFQAVSSSKFQYPGSNHNPSNLEA